MAEGTGLVIKVVQVTGIPSSTDNDASDIYCVMSTGTCRFTTKSLPAKHNSTPWPESFLLSPRDIKHASQRIVAGTTNAPPPSVTAASEADTPSDGLNRSSSPTAYSSPVLTIELWSSKRWGADAVTATGELLLGPYLASLKPNGPALQARVALKNPKASSKAASKAGRGATAAGLGSSPGFESGWVLGAEVQCMMLELMAVAAPPLPVNLLGPVGSGRAEVPPTHSCSTTWLGPHRPVLHTSGGYLYQTPTIQHIKITLHRAQGLQNLHVDPQAAAAAAAVISKLGAAGEAPSRAERARIAATNAVLETKVGRSLFNKTSSWFNRNKAPSFAAAGAAVTAAAALSQTAAATRAQSAAVAGAQSTAAAGLISSDTAVGTQPAAAAAVSTTPRSESPDVRALAAAAAAGPAGTPRAATPSTSVSGNPAGATGSNSSSGLSRSASPTLAGNADAADITPGNSNITPTDAEVTDITTSDPTDLNQDDAAAEAAAIAAVATLDDSTDSFAVDETLDPVSRLQQVTQHLRKASVDTEAVMSALEENGFHATDAPGGAYVYARLGVGPEGENITSRVVELRAGGEAVWEQSFWVPVTRPAAAGSSLEIELLASKDDKSRGRSVAVVKVPLHHLLRSPQQSSRSGSQADADGSSSSSTETPLWFKASHTLQASISDHLHCSLRVTVEAADWDTRAAAANIPRAFLPDGLNPARDPLNPATASATGPQNPQNPRPQLLINPANSAPGSAANSPRGSPRKQPASLASQLNPGAAAAAGLDPAGGVGLNPNVADRGAGSPRPGAVPLQLQQRQDSAASSNGSVASGFTTPVGNSSSSGGGSSSLGRVTSEGQIAGGGAAAAAAAAVANLDVVVKAFETRKPLDVFFVLLLGPYCVVSSTSHSTHHHSWGWHIKVPVTEPADILTLALFAREDQAGGKKKVGASMLTMFSNTIKLVGKLRVRLSTLTANTPINVSMPLQGDRTNLRAGHPAAATAHLYFHLAVPQLFGSYLLSYFKYTASSPGLYLLARKSSRRSPASQENSLDVLGMQAQQTVARWLESQPPFLPMKVYRKVQDDGRVEFTLSKTRSNWRRLILLRESLAPARAAFDHLCSWENYLHSGACYCVILLFGLYPSKVLSILLLLVCIAIARAAVAPSRPASPPPAAAKAAAAAAAVAPPAALVSAAGGGTAGGRLSSAFQRFMPIRPPPVMSDPGLLTAAEEQQQQQQQGSAVVTDPYTSLKQNYEGLVLFLTTVQNVVDGWATAGERIQSAFSWSDQLATAVLLVIMLLLAVGLWVLGIQVLVTVGLLWVFRHPVLRDPLPPPPVNFVARMPTRSDTML